MSFRSKLSDLWFNHKYKILVCGVSLLAVVISITFDTMFFMAVLLGATSIYSGTRLDNDN